MNKKMLTLRPMSVDILRIFLKIQSVFELLPALSVGGHSSVTDYLLIFKGWLRRVMGTEHSSGLAE